MAMLSSNYLYKLLIGREIWWRVCIYSKIYA